MDRGPSLRSNRTRARRTLTQVGVVVIREPYPPRPRVEQRSNVQCGDAFDTSHDAHHTHTRGRPTTQQNHIPLRKARDERFNNGESLVEPLSIRDLSVMNSPPEEFAKRTKVMIRRADPVDVAIALVRQRSEEPMLRDSVQGVLKCSRRSLSRVRGNHRTGCQILLWPAGRAGDPDDHALAGLTERLTKRSCNVRCHLLVLASDDRGSRRDRAHLAIVEAREAERLLPG